MRCGAGGPGSRSRSSRGAAGWWRRTSSSRSTGSRRRWTRRSRSVAATGCSAISFGHAGDGNLHSAFLVSPDDPDELERVTYAVDDLFDLAVRLGGSVSGEHGLGLLKRGELARQWPSRALDLHGGIKRLFDPKNLLNPGKKLARPLPGAEHPPVATRS